jgi:hypothetical protein
MPSTIALAAADQCLADDLDQFGEAIFGKLGIDLAVLEAVATLGGAA